MLRDNEETMIEAFIRKGYWERFEHPEKGSTVTGFLGKVALISLHNDLLNEADGISSSVVMRFWDQMSTQSLSANLLARVAYLEKELQIATAAMAAAGLGQSERTEAD